MKEIYTPTEKFLIEAMIAHEERQKALDALKKVETALELDLMLLEMEKKQGMMDGVSLQEWIL